LIAVVENRITERFVSWGVNVEISSNKREVFDLAMKNARESLLDNLQQTDSEPVVRFLVDQERDGMYSMVRNDEEPQKGHEPKTFFKLFEAMVRVAVGEFAPNHVFIHAGSVGWRGRAVIMPAVSFSGKSTLTAALLREGAEYLSDEYAIIDADGLVHPYPRPLYFRTEDFVPFERTVEELGGTAATQPLPLGTVVLTRYLEGARWTPELLRPGVGAMSILPHVLSLKHNPKFAMEVLHKVSTRAIIASGSRGSAETFAKTLLNFVDKASD
jgi:hypothetical protein